MYNNMAITQTDTQLCKLCIQQGRSCPSIDGRDICRICLLRCCSSKTKQLNNFTVISVVQKGDNMIVYDNAQSSPIGYIQLSIHGANFINLIYRRVTDFDNIPGLIEHINQILI
jgi:hypothetical protein